MVELESCPVGAAEDDHIRREVYIPPYPPTHLDEATAILRYRCTVYDQVPSHTVPSERNAAAVCIRKLTVHPNTLPKAGRAWNHSVPSASPAPF